MSLPARSAALALIALATIATTTASAAPDAEPMTKARAKSILARPAGSVSLGGTSGGRLLAPVELPASGPGYRVIPGMVGRHTNWGTEELVGLVRRATARVARLYPGAVVGVGNLGSKDGGKIRWSVSHQAGRDADLSMFALDATGAPTTHLPMVFYEADGRARGGRYRFDVDRNLALVVALVEDPEVAVQYIFVAEWLKTMLIDAAQQKGLSAPLVTRLTQILHQPSDSNPHADHYHIRIYCSVEDRLEGCVDRGPIHPWVDLGDADFDRRVDELVAILGLEDHALRLAALGRLAELRATRALPATLTALTDARADIRAAALRAVRAVPGTDVISGVVNLLPTIEDGAWAARVFDVIVDLGSPETLRAARAVADDPAAVLHPKALARARVPVLVGAAEVMGRFGRKDVVPRLLALVDDDDAKLRAAAHDALVAVTNQRIPSSGLTSRRAARRAKVVQRWRAFWEAEGDESWLQWMRLGFEARGLRFSGRMASPEGVAVLIDALDHRDRVLAHNACKTLSEMTGHYVDPTWRSARNTQRHWRHWWQRNRAAVDLP